MNDQPKQVPRRGFLATTAFTLCAPLSLIGIAPRKQNQITFVIGGNDGETHETIAVVDFRPGMMICVPPGTKYHFPRGSEIHSPEHADTY